MTWGVWGSPYLGSTGTKRACFGWGIAGLLGLLSYGVPVLTLKVCIPNQRNFLVVGWFERRGLAESQLWVMSPLVGISL